MLPLSIDTLQCKRAGVSVFCHVATLSADCSKCQHPYQFELSTRLWPVEWHGESSPSQTSVRNAKLLSFNPTAKAEWLQRSGHTPIRIQAMSLFPWMVKDSLHTVTQSQTDIGDDRAGCWQEGNVSFKGSLLC